MTIGKEAIKPNPALRPFEPLIGEWKTTGSHPMLPGRTLHGRVSFEWIEGGAFLLERSEVDAPEVPSGIVIYGSDDQEGVFFMSYFDERGVSRRYEVTMDGRVMTWNRDDPKFRQRMTFTIDPGGRPIVGKGEMSREGKDWEGDLEMTFERV
jgi:hypothetical protein